jgi:hypothetical protein
MRRMFTALVASFAVVAFSSMTFAQAPAPAKTAKPAVEKVAKTADQTAKHAKGEAKEAAKKATTATGTIEKYDAATKTLTVKTKKGDENFMLNADTKIAAGTKTATDTELVAGKHVKVAYSDNAGQMTATKVTLAGEKAPKASKTEKKEEKK